MKSLQTNWNIFKQKIELESPYLKQRINFIGKPQEDNEATMYFTIEKSEETTFEFLKNFVSII